MNLKVMTYNIRLGLDSSLADIASMIKDYEIPDILALQEVGHHWNMGEKVDQTAVLADALGLTHHYFAGALQDKDGGEYGIALLSRWSIASIDVIGHPQEDDENRLLLVAHIDAPKPFIVITSHLSICEMERRKQAELTAQVASAHDAPTLILGDFNARPESEEYRVLTEIAEDAFALGGQGPSETFSVANPHRQIDYIMFRGGFDISGSCSVLRHIVTSDHFPLWASLSL